MSLIVKRNSRVFAHEGPPVSFGSSLDAKELVKQAVDIVDLVGRFITLRRQGRMFVGLCPWHDDSRPSLQVNAERQSFKCWVCDIGGDVFSFLMKMEGVTFPEALQMLADQAGIALKPSHSQARGGGPADKRTLYQAAAWAEEQYHQCLLTAPEAEPARQYLSSRRLSPESLRKYHLGYCPQARDWLLGQARKTRFDARILETIGIVSHAQGGSIYDRFRGRVLFSIRDSQGRPVALGGRLLPGMEGTSPAKYVNSPETPLFLKHKMLYGLDIAQQAIRRSGMALVMEGYTDCIVAQQCGFENAVAVLGTALGEDHLRILRHLTDRIVLVLDGDEAGQKRTKEVLELFVAAKVDLRILTLPDDLDPCDFLHQRGAEAFRQLLAEETVDALEHAFRVHTRGIDLANDIHAASGALERLVAIVAKAPRLRLDSTREDRFREEKVLQRLASSFRVPEKEVRQRLTELRRSGQRRPAAPPARAASPTTAEPVGRMEPWQRELLELLVRFPVTVARAAEQIPPAQVSHAPCRKIYETCCRLAGDGQEPTFDRLMLEFDDPGIQNLLVELDESGQAKGIGQPEGLLEEVIRSYQRWKSEKQRPAAREALEGNLDQRAQLDLLAALLQHERTRHGISTPTEGQDQGRVDRDLD